MKSTFHRLVLNPEYFLHDIANNSIPISTSELYTYTQKSSPHVSEHLAPKGILIIR